MDDQDRDDGFIFDAYPEMVPSGPSTWEKFFTFLVYITFATAFIFLVMSIFFTLDPSWGSSLTQPVNPFIFILLIVLSFPQVSLLSIFVVMFILYLIFFSSMVYENRRERKKKLLDTPIGYFIAAATAVEVVVVIITLLEHYFGTPIGGGGIDTELKNNPLLGYMSLIYAPFVEELGFRILPLGIFSALLVLFSIRTRGEHAPESMRDTLLAIILPGHIRRKYDLPLRGADWVLIIITSIIFGYAHIFFGGWDWGKFIPVFITGIALAIGFLKFGAYVDIPFHWFFNGFLTLYNIEPSLYGATNLLVIWLLFVGVVSIISILMYARERLRRGGTAPA